MLSDGIYELGGNEKLAIDAFRKVFRAGNTICQVVYYKLNQSAKVNEDVKAQDPHLADAIRISKGISEWADKQTLK
jgi:hypothetical protein